jgi:ribosomal protein S18 acetylase RimI-like enzyme
MTTTTMVIRPARRADAKEIAEVHDRAWRESYRGVIRGVTLERMIEGRGPVWWDRFMAHGNAIHVFEFAGAIAGYVTFGRTRQRSEAFPGQIYELYLQPEYQGLGFGGMLLNSARAALSGGKRPYLATCIWALAANDRANGFYLHLGAKEIGRRIERIGGDVYETIGYGFA